MKLSFIKQISDIFNFKTVADKNSNKYILFANSTINEINFEVEDKTRFEALENHVHLSDNINNSNYNEAIEIGKILGETQLNALKSKYPDKEFCVFVTVDIGESMIIRFHQVWKNEPPYYNPDDFNSDKTKVLMFRK